MATEKYVITGGQGFVGSWIIKHLLDENTNAGHVKNEVEVWDIKEDNHILEQVLDASQMTAFKRVYGDISDTSFVLNAFEASKPTHVIHLAGLQVPTCRANPLLGAKVNVIGTLNIFEGVKALRQKGHVVKGIVYASSAAVAGVPEDYDTEINDDASHKPRTHYGVFKTANEWNARIYWQDDKISSVGLRPLTIYGVGREIGVTSGPTKALKAAVLGRPYKVPFVGSTAYNYVEDVANIFIRCVRADAQGAYALNIKGDVLDLVDFVKVLEETVPSAKGTITSEGNPLPLAYNFSEAGLEQLLGESPIKTTPIVEGVRRIVDRFTNLKNKGSLHDNDLK